MSEQTNGVTSASCLCCGLSSSRGVFDPISLRPFPKLSQCVDDSPASDNKMDISEPTTASQGSSVISPESDRLANDDDLLFACSKTSLKADQSGQQSLENFKNRNIVSHSSLTLVDEHPLMLLSADENDLPEPTVPRVVRHAAHSNIPDVVPALDHSPINDSLASPSRNAEDNKTDFRNKQSFSSDESDPDMSQYQAYVEPTYQSVALTNCAAVKPRQPLRKIPLTPELMSRDDPSSVETFSSNSFDEDFDEIDAAVTSSQITKSNNKSRSNVANDTGFSELDDPKESAIEPSAPPRQLLSVTLADGQHRDIDMKVIEPYKRVLSHGGYLKAGGHNAIVIFSACFLPDRSRTDYNYVMENLFL